MSTNQSCDNGQRLTIKACPNPHCDAVYHNCPKNKTHCLDCDGNMIEINEETYWRKFKDNFFQYDYSTHEYYHPRQAVEQLALDI